jgi:hypothetical protein
VNAAEMGFKRDDAEQAAAMIEAAAASSEVFDVAMDLARYVHIPLGEATVALVLGMNDPRRLRRLGFEVANGLPPSEVLALVGKQVDGQAALYATTWMGQMEVREAHGYTFSAVFWRMWEAMFGPRS